MKLSVGSSKRVFCKADEHGSVRFWVLSPRSLSCARPAGLFWRFWMPTSERKRPPRSKIRSTFPGWLIIAGRGSRKGHDTVHSLFLFAWWRDSLQSHGRAIHAVAFAITRMLLRHGTIVIRAAPHSMQPWVIMLLRFSSTSQGWQLGAATDSVGIKVARVDEADEVGRFMIEHRVGSNRIGADRHTSGFWDMTWACSFTCRCPPCHHDSLCNPAVLFPCSGGSWLPVWQVMRPVLLAAACSSVCRQVDSDQSWRHRVGAGGPDFV